MTLVANPTVEQLVGYIEEAMHRGDMPTIEQIVLAYRGTPYERALLSDRRIVHLAAGLRDAYSAYETNDERELRNRLLGEASRITGSAPVERTYAYVPLEAAAAGIGQWARYCHVGSGPFPETLLAMHAVAPDAVLTGADADAEAVQLGREFTQKMHPHSAISFLHAAGDALNYREFTHVHVAVLVRPEYDVVRRVCETANADVIIMLRTAGGLSSLLYQPIATATQELLASRGFERLATVRGHAIMSTAIYRR